MKPSLGRIVHYHHHGKTLAAVIVKVHSDTCVNLCVLNENGQTFGETSVVLADAEVATEESRSPYASWPPRI